MTWNVLYTKPRNEKKVRDRLLKQGIDCYCPLQKTLKQWSDRKKWVEEPIFKSYLFVKAPETDSQKMAILQTLGVVRFLFWLGSVAQVKEEEIIAIKSFLGNYDSVDVRSYDPGTELKVKEGSLKGATGVVLYQAKNKIVLNVRQLGMSLIARLPVSDVERSD
ncbi:UpxY family transcription antiterminator [Flavobacteriales bacterium]|nr:UpxY family transcription antiterminator [Flavobacteriales bacterium]